ncbi:MAG: hypothetical protein A2W04_04450 [Betaproteobacteria bacterium RBG_16_64_9]|nr:MAG: hypothetical protein A2W04_04450 [Betaproteobacteria bacterium RBG_16_64_9]OGA22520.1 MAG: hypothetical protein A3I01_17735 [Betaproteobacteria bacterium RIFCSPLOWO2_02_FULL_65_24]OGA37229.1 MAG: hypothetical protein A3G80_09450 [Betaproteobacteria bacterium RIFCSPLOWO2_12_FULL_62_13b]
MKISQDDVRWLLKAQNDDPKAGTIPDFEKSRLFVLGLLEEKDGVILITRKGKETLNPWFKADAEV